MARSFHEIAFTPAVKAQQARRGSRDAYARVEKNAAADQAAGALSEQEAAFIASRDSFYLASVSETGWPYVQHRGGPPGFVRRLDAKTIGWAEFAGNRQYISAGNTAVDDRVAMIFMDYPHQRRLKILGHLRAYEAPERPDLASPLSVPGYKGRVERYLLVEVEAYDWNCPQHITPRFTLAEIDGMMAPVGARIRELEAQVENCEPAPGRG